MLLEINDVIKKEEQSTVVHREMLENVLTYLLNGFLPILGNN